MVDRRGRQACTHGDVRAPKHACVSTRNSPRGAWRMACPPLNSNSSCKLCQVWMSLGGHLNVVLGDERCRWRRVGIGVESGGRFRRSAPCARVLRPAVPHLGVGGRSEASCRRVGVTCGARPRELADTAGEDGAGHREPRSRPGARGEAPRMLAVGVPGAPSGKAGGQCVFRAWRRGGVTPGSAGAARRCYRRP